MTEVPDASERYLRQLGEGLQALGPEESAEIVQEVRSHLAEATAEAGGDLDVALARFGSPDDLAKKILEERGILVENPAVPPAAGWRRAVALSIDVLFWMIAVTLLSGLGLGILPWLMYASPRPLRIVVSCVYLAVIVFLLGRRWLRPWTRSCYQSMGMQVLGLRLVRVGEKTRLVRAGDVAGARRWGVGRIYTCILTLAVLCGVGYYLYQVVWVNPGRDQQAAVQGVRNDSSEAVRVVSEAYCLAIAAAGPAEPQLNDLYVPSARGIAQELAGRHTAGRLQCYTILSVQLPDYKWPGPGEMGRPSGQVVAVIQVAESGSDSSLAGAYDYTLVRNVHVTRSGLTTSEWFGQWQIESVKVEGS